MFLQVVASTLFAATSSLAQHAAVPFVGCPSDGQTGPLRAPAGKPKFVPLPPEIARQLAWYQAKEGPGTLGPRGWHCFSTYGSNGSSLFISPQLLNSTTFFSHHNGIPVTAKFTGPAIQLSEMVGDTSGRFSVALSIARLFPAHRDFAERVRAEHLGLDKLPSGPEPTDKLHYLSKEAVEFTTPGNRDGEGTDTLLVKSDLPITGVVMLTGEERSCTTLAIRLPPELGNLAPMITHQLEHNADSTRSR